MYDLDMTNSICRRGSRVQDVVEGLLEFRAITPVVTDHVPCIMKVAKTLRIIDIYENRILV